jgi:predicted nucleic acid-binding Zn ribbon protein
MDDDGTPERAGPADTGTSDPRGPKGSDLAREALAEARRRNAEKRKAVGRTPLVRRSGRGTRRRWSGPGSDAARDPQPLGATLRRWVDQAGVGADLTKAQIFGRWDQIVGREVADHCRPVSLVEGELVLQAESTAWATQLRLLAPTVVKRINQELGDGSVRRIRAQGPAGPSWRFGSRHVPGRGPRDTYG